MKHRIDIRGVLIPNDYKWYYSFFGEDSTCPRDIQNIIDAAVEGDEIEAMNWEEPSVSKDSIIIFITC